jgi:hypothetical protein
VIRARLADLDTAGGRAIKLLRVAHEETAILELLLEILGRAAESPRATYWSLDLARIRLRPIATWSAVAPDAAAPHRGLRYLTALRCRTNAARVWRSRKPLWSNSIVLETDAPPPGADELGSGVWFAVKSDTFVYGVIELLCRTLEQRAPDNLVMLERLGFRLGQALEELRHGDMPRH